MRKFLARRYAIKRRFQIDRALQHITRRAVGDFHAVDEARLAGYALCSLSFLNAIKLSEPDIMTSRIQSQPNSLGIDNMENFQNLCQHP